MNSREWRAAFGFSLQLWLSAIISLGVAFFLQLDSPYWAAIAACIVSQPAPGMAISKAIYRLVGTVVGAVMGVMLIAVFAQTPELFIAMLGAWIGLCTLASNLLRNFRAYGAVLAGFTAAVVSLAAFDQPAQVFYIGISRASATIVGIVCAMLVTILLAPHRAQAQVVNKLRRTLGLVAQRVSLSFDSSMEERLAIGRRNVQALIDLDPEIDFAAAEDSGFRIHANGARSLVIHLFESISARRALEARVHRATARIGEDLTGLIAESCQTLAMISQRIEGGEWADYHDALEPLRDRIRGVSALEEKESDGTSATRRIIFDRLTEMMDHFSAALDDMSAMTGSYAKQATITFNFHRDHRLAIINALRAFLAIGIAGWFWIETAWPSGSTMLIQVGVVCSLFSASPQPDRQGMSFFIGTIFASVASYICLYLILNHLEGFVPLAAALALFLIPGGMAMSFPRTTGVGFAYTVNFFTLLHPLNVMNYDVSSFLNSVLAVLAGTFLGTLAYLLFLPPDPRAERRYVVHRIRRGLEIISSQVPAPTAAGWQTRMYDRVNRLYQPKNPSGTPTEEWYEEGLAALNLGNELLRVRALADDQSSPTARPVLAAFARAARYPERVSPAADEARNMLEREPLPADPARRRDFLRLKGAVEEIQFYLRTYGILTRPLHRGPEAA